MGDIIVKAIPFIIPAILVGSWLVNNKPQIPGKKSGGEKSEAKSTTKSEAPKKDESDAGSEMTSL